MKNAQAIDTFTMSKKSMLVRGIWTLLTSAAFGSAIVLAASFAPDATSKPPREAPIASVEASTDGGIQLSTPVEVAATPVPAAPVQADPTPISLAPEATDEDVDFETEATSKLDGGDLEGALVAVRKSLHGREPSSGDLVRVGTLAREVKQHELANRALEAAVALDGTSAEARLELARLRLDQGNASDAETHASAAVKLDPSNGSAWNVLGRSALERSHWQRAELALRKAVELEPTQAVLHNNLGLLYVRTRDAEKAIDALETAVELYGDEAPPFVFNNLGLAHEMKKELELARDAFEQALALDPTYARAAVNLKRVEDAIEATLEEPAPVSALEEPHTPVAIHCVRVKADLCDG